MHASEEREKMKGEVRQWKGIQDQRRQRSREERKGGRSPCLSPKALLVSRPCYPPCPGWLKSEGLMDGMFHASWSSTELEERMP